MLPAIAAGNAATRSSTPSTRNFTSNSRAGRLQVDVGGAGVSGGGQHGIDRARRVVGMARIERPKFTGQQIADWLRHRPPFYHAGPGGANIGVNVKAGDLQGGDSAQCRENRHSECGKNLLADRASA